MSRGESSSLNHMIYFRNCWSKPKRFVLCQSKNALIFGMRGSSKFQQLLVHYDKFNPLLTTFFHLPSTGGTTDL
jgi:hypothetical protein